MGFASALLKSKFISAEIEVRRSASVHSAQIEVWVFRRPARQLVLRSQLRKPPETGKCISILRASKKCPLIRLDPLDDPGLDRAGPLRRYNCAPCFYPYFLWLLEILFSPIPKLDETSSTPVAALYFGPVFISRTQWIITIRCISRQNPPVLSKGAKRGGILTKSAIFDQK